MNNITKLPISKFIDLKFRDYSLYVITSRGIPNFYDSLTPVQRYILMNAPSSFQKTLTLVGNCIAGGYHHGDASLSSAISKLARPFGCALQILEGYGFFGSEICPDPAAARYTSIKISAKANDILRKYNFLITKNEDGAYHSIWMDIPIGLTTPITGIAVGYKSTILPRKLEDIEKFLEGKIKTLKPYFLNFDGSIEKYNGMPNAWLIRSNIKINGNRIEIRGIPPLLKYSSALKRLDWLFNKFEGTIRIINNSNTKVNIDIVYTAKKQEEWNEIKDFCNKVFSIIVTENPVFVKDEKVLVYDSVEQYLTDYVWQVKRLAYNKSLYEKNFLVKELSFNKAKEEFINFVLLKKRTVIEIDDFLKPFDIKARDRLERLTSKKFTKDELLETQGKIKQLTTELKDKEKELKENKAIFDKCIDPTLKRSITSKKVSTDLFNIEDVKEVDGIYIWSGEDVVEEKEENKKENVE
jgi:hypothetical protein